MATDPIYPMLLADAGNTSVKFAILGRSCAKPRMIAVIPTKNLTTAHVRSLWKKSRARTAAASCVVPEVARILQTGCPPIHLISGKSALHFTTLVDRRTVGADRLANMAQAVQKFGKNVIVADFGTAATFDVLNGSGCFAGGAIAPGVSTMAAILSAKTAQLPVADRRKIGRVTGRNTREAVRSGVVGGYAGMVRHLLAALTEENFRGQRPCLVFTGGDASTVARWCGLQPLIDPAWTLRGTAVLGERAAREH